MKRLYSYNKVNIFIIILISLAILFGIIYYNLQTTAMKNNIITTINGVNSYIQNSQQNLILQHVLIILVLFFLAYTIIGMPLILFYLFYESTSIGLLLAGFYAAFKLSGLIFMLIYLFLCKLLYILVIIYISLIALKTTKRLIRMLIYKDNISLYVVLKNLFFKLSLTLVIVLIYDILMYFFANKILSLFLFLLA